MRVVPSLGLRIGGRCFLGMQELTAISVLAAPALLEIDAYFGLVMFVELSLASQLLLSMRKRALKIGESLRID